MDKEVYTLIQENYNEWAWENGACDLIGVYDDLEKLKKDLRKYLIMDVEESRILDNHDSIDYILSHITEENSSRRVDVYLGETEYQQGTNHAAYSIEKRKINSDK